MKKFLSILAFAASAFLATAAITPMTNIVITVSGGDNLLSSLTGAGNTYTILGLANGTTTGTSNGIPNIYSHPRIDDPFTSTIVGNPGNNPSGGASLPVRTVLFGGQNWTNSNGSLLDFFIIEASTGSGDAISVAAIFTDDTIGVATNIVAGNWPRAIPNVLVGGDTQADQFLCGVGFSITDLRATVANGGTNLVAGDTIKGIAITAGGGVDPAGVWASVEPSGIVNFVVTPSVSVTNVGDVFELTITGVDAFNAIVLNSTLTVTVSGGTNLMEFDWNRDGTYGDNSGKLASGTTNIFARNKKAVITSISAFGGGAVTATPASVQTVAVAFSQLQVLVPGETGAPGTATGKTGNPTVQGLGAPFDVTVNAVDLYWNFLAAAPGDTISISVTNELGVITALPVVNAPLSGGTVLFSVTFTNNGPTNYIVAADVINPAITNGVSAIVNASQSLIWQGDGVTNNWDVLTTANWTNLLGTVIQYNNGNFVAFDDTGSVTPAVNIVGTVSPLSVNLNSANSYSFITTNGGGIGGTGPLNKVGAGNLRLATSNSYTGGTRFTDGILTVAAYTNAVPNSGALIFTNATLVLETNLVHNSGSTRIVAGAGGSFTIAAAGTNRALTLNGVTWGGTTTSLFPGEAGASLILGRASDNTTLEIKSQITLSGGNLGGNRRFVVANGDKDVDVLLSGQIDDTGATPGGLRKQGAGTLQLSASNSNYDGDTTIEEGRFIATGGWNKASGRTIILGDGVNNVTLQLGSAIALNNVNVGTITAPFGGTHKVIGGNPTNHSIITFVSNAVTTASSSLGQALGGAGANENNLGLTKNTTNYTLTLDAANTYVGPTTIAAGTLALGAGSINNTTNINVQSGATFDVSTPGSFTLGAGKVLRGGGAINGNVTANGIVTPGSSGIGTLTFSNDLTLGASASLVMEINPTPTNDTITVLGTFTPGGALVITNIGGTLVLGNTFQLFSTAVVGSFSSTVLPVTPDGLTWTNKLAVDGTIVVVAAPISSNAYLTSLVLSPAGTLSPTFGSNVFTYTATNAFGISPTVKVVNANLTATNKLIYNNVTNSLASGVASSPLALTLGVNNPVVVEVTAQDGITVLSYTVNLTMQPSLVQPKLTNSVSGTTLSLSWPASNLGYTLQQQTNSLSLGLSTNWVAVPGSASVTSTNVTIDATSPTVFYRLVYP